MTDFWKLPMVLVALIWTHSALVFSLGNLNAVHVSSCTETDQLGNSYGAELAMDADENTCAKTCYQRGSWIRVNVNQPGFVNNVTIRGFLPQYTQIRLGDRFSDVELRDGFTENPVCLLQTDTPTSNIPGDVQHHTFQCTVARQGSVLSFRSGDTDKAQQLILCDVAVA